jgi:hypothetical protein
MLRFYYLLTMILIFSTAAHSAVQVRISNLSDINVPLWVTGDPGITEDVFVCVYRANDADGTTATYNITATGDGPGFLLKSGMNTLAYSVTWNDGGAGNPSGGTSSPFITSVALSNRQNARIQSDTPTNSDDCNAGASNTARLRIAVTNTNLEAAYDGTYEGTITLLVAPN